MTNKEMTNEEAIARIREHKIVHKMNEPRAIYISEALDMAIKALEQQPCEDCISRQAVLNLPRKTLKNYFGEVVGDVIYVKDVMELPPVTPQQKMGRWINVDTTHSKCDTCGAVFEIASENGEANYCPNCGQPKMQEVEE